MLAKARHSLGALFGREGGTKSASDGYARWSRGLVRNVGIGSGSSKRVFLVKHFHLFRGKNVGSWEPLIGGGSIAFPFD